MLDKKVVGLVIVAIIGWSVAVVGWGTLFSYSEEVSKTYNQSSLTPPYVQLENREAKMMFNASDGSTHGWKISLDTYEAQVRQSWYKKEVSGLEYMNLSDSETGETHKVVDFTKFVVENNFDKVLSDLYQELNRNDKEFIYEIWYTVTQLTTYNSETEETPRYPLETMIGGGGDCEDLAILVASMLETRPDYKVQLLYMDSDNPENPVNPNHVLVWVETPGVYETFVDATCNTQMCPYSQVEGWYIDA